jgi:urease accessory protein
MKILLALIALSAMAFGHTTTLESGGFSSGFLHPVSGLDHILAMVGVGMLAYASARKGAVLLIAFMGAMVVAATIGFAGVTFAYTEQGILLSIAAVFALIGFAKQIPMGAIVAIIAFFGMFHGFAHGAEFQSGSFLAYMAGFSTSTLLLHISGIALAYAYAKTAMKKQTELA